MTDSARLADEVERFGHVAFLVTVNDDGSPHVTSVAVEVAGASLLSAHAGNRSSANAAARPRVSFMWSPSAGGDYALIVDGNAAVDASGALAVACDRAVLHRLATADAALPSCVTLTTD